jgi:starch phosphorylase
MAGTRFSLELNPRIPAILSRLRDLAGDLYYSWDRFSRGLFYQLDSDLWQRCQHNPSVFLRRISQRRLNEAARDRVFLEAYHRALANYDAYMETDPEVPNEFGLLAQDGPIAYFSAEFGLHESLPIYSGGLGILAGDLCKAASDLRLPFVAVGLLFRYGNFKQQIDEAGWQHLHNELVSDEDLPIRRVLTADGTPLTLSLPVGDAQIEVRAWWAKAGHARLLLLDTDCEGNAPDDQCITHNLYPGDPGDRLKQEIVLGIGGATALAALGIEPRVWHVNEGHPALAIVARCARYVSQGLGFDTAVELVAANTVFTTHTPVTAGHEVFPHDLIRAHLGRYLQDNGVALDDLFALGGNGVRGEFSLTTFALRSAGHRNGVSRMHGQVASKMEARIWPEIAAEENPIEYITNGVHVPTFLAREWDRRLDDPGWRTEFANPGYWQKAISSISNEELWSGHLTLKLRLIEDIKQRVRRRGQRLGLSEAQIGRELLVLGRGPDVLLIGFARRFAAYKRATLLLHDHERLERLLGDAQRPVVIIFAGRAHQNDEVGRGLIREIHTASREARFHGRILLLEDYDLALARKLVTGADVWVNTPEFPFEASGTSGMKAGINGVINVSVADGWWREGYSGDNGWSIEPHPQEADAGKRRKAEAEELLDVLEHEVIPAYFQRRDGYPAGWLERMRASMISVVPHFNAERMLTDYVQRFYLPAIEREAQLRAPDAQPAAALAAWRHKVREHWGRVDLRLRGSIPLNAEQGNPVTIEVEASHPGLAAEDIVVECLIENAENEEHGPALQVALLPRHPTIDETTIYGAELQDGLAGLLELRIRAYPSHRHLSHPFDMGLMRWL